MGLRRLAFVALLGGGADGAAYLASLGDGRTIAGLTAGGVGVSRLDARALDARLREIERAFAEGEVRFHLGAGLGRVTRERAGLRLDLAALRRAVRAAGRSGRPWRDLALRARARRGRLDVGLAAYVDERAALDFLDALKDDVDRPARDARLDLARRAVAPEEPGVLVRVYESLDALVGAAREGRDDVALPITETSPRVRRDALAGIDISAVLGWYETPYSQAPGDADRAWNLKLIAAKIDGAVLPPGAELSFNAVVGDRTEKEGYRTAPVISAGELVDGLAGGACQISSTLHAAAFFAGLEIVAVHPHSRPSAYIVMGLDATVVYPNVDLGLRNPYDFPVAVHAKVALGRARVEILGRARPYRAVFERETMEELPFRRETRVDPELPQGQRRVEQAGLSGYRLLQRRILYDGEREVRRDEWRRGYPPTTEYLRLGTKVVEGKVPPPPKESPLPALLRSPSPKLRIER